MFFTDSVKTRKDKKYFFKDAGRTLYGYCKNLYRSTKAFFTDIVKLRKVANVFVSITVKSRKGDV